MILAVDDFSLFKVIDQDYAKRIPKNSGQMMELPLLFSKLVQLSGFIVSTGP